jgi:hypothetical protein
MIVYANGKVLATDTEGDTQSIGVVGVYQDELKTSDHEQENILLKILKELKKNNLHMSLLTDTNIKNSDVGGGYD